MLTRQIRRSFRRRRKGALRGSFSRPNRKCASVFWGRLYLGKCISCLFSLSLTLHTLESCTMQFQNFIVIYQKRSERRVLQAFRGTSRWGKHYILVPWSLWWMFSASSSLLVISTSPLDLVRRFGVVLNMFLREINFLCVMKFSKFHVNSCNVYK